MERKKREKKEELLGKVTMKGRERCHMVDDGDSGSILEMMLLSMSMGMDIRFIRSGGLRRRRRRNARARTGGNIRFCATADISDEKTADKRFVGG